MLRRVFHIICSLWLASLLMLGITPADAIHAFAHHTDTVHHRDVKGSVAEPEHHHCGFLSFQLMPFHVPPTMPLPRPFVTPQHHSVLRAQDERACQQAVALREGRGPPAADLSLV